MVRGFDAVMAVDWSATSGRTRPKDNTLHLAVAQAGGVGAARHFPTRHGLVAHLIADLCARAGRGERVLAVFDVAFGWPAGAARHVTGADDPLALWDWMAGALTDAEDGRNDRFEVAERLNGMLPGPGPFWGRDRTHVHLTGLGTHKPAAIQFDEWRRTERAMIAAGGAAGRPKSTWQLAYNGSVGGQTLTAMAALAKVRAALGDRCAVWPFEAAEAPVVLAECYLAHADGAAPLWMGPGDPKDAGQVRAMAAGVLGALRGGADLLAAPAEPEAAEEGWVLGIGHEAAIEGAARAAARPPDAPMPAAGPQPAGPDAAPAASPAAPVPPPLRDDCFALPRGVDWTPMDAALGRLRKALAPVAGVEEVPLAEADRRVLARGVAARRANPPAANAAVDGFGFAHGRVADPAAIPLASGRAAAGAPFAGAVPAGAAVPILTGAILPEGVDTVALQEDAAAGGGVVALSALPRRGANTRPAGEDAAAGAAVLAAGRRLTPGDLALAAATGHGALPVRARLRVGVLSTGDELAEPGGEAEAHRTFDANRPMLLSLVRRWGHDARDLGRAADERGALRVALDGAGCDAVLTSGGASAGAEDHLSALMRAEGHVADWRIAIKPGRPLMLGTWGGVPVFGLPGNPVAAFTCALLFARPALEVLAGADWPEPQGFDVPAGFAKRKKPGRREYLRARLRGGRAEVYPSEGSGRTSGLAWAEGFVELEDGAREVAPGDPVRFLPFGAFGL